MSLTIADSKHACFKRGEVFAGWKPLTAVASRSLVQLPDDVRLRVRYQPLDLKISFLRSEIAFSGLLGMQSNHFLLYPGCVTHCKRQQQQLWLLAPLAFSPPSFLLLFALKQEGKDSIYPEL